MSVLVIDNVTDAMLDALVSLWETPQESPREELQWSTKRARGWLHSLPEIADRIPQVEDEFLIVKPLTSGWYTQCLLTNDRWLTECAVWEAETNTVHNHQIRYEDGSNLKLATAYAVMAEFCRSQQWGDSYATTYAEY